MQSEFKSQIYLIESGKPLELVQEFIRQREHAFKQARAIAKKYKADRFKLDCFTGVAVGLRFKSAIPEGFKIPKGPERICYPKKGSEVEAEFKKQRGHAIASEMIANAYQVPCGYSYTVFDENGKNVGTGSRSIGMPFEPCGFSFNSPEGPFALWIPDVPSYIADAKAKNYGLTEEFESYKMDETGLKRIEREEWEILMLQQKLAEKKKAA